MISVIAGCYRSSFAQVAQVITNNENSKSTSRRRSKRPEDYFDFSLYFDDLCKSSKHNEKPKSSAERSLQRPSDGSAPGLSC